MIVTKVTATVPDIDAIGDLAIAAAQNARRLLEDAEILLMRDRWPSAYSLAVLACEEAGKAYLCVIAMHMPDEIRPQFPFRALDWNHLFKLQAANGLAGILAFARGGNEAADKFVLAMATADDVAREHNQGKKRGFYADYRDGAVWNPSAVGPSEARAMVSKARDILDHSGPFVQPEFLAWLTRPPADAREWRDSFLARVFGVAGEGEDAMAAAIQDEFSKMPGLPEMLDDLSPRRRAPTIRSRPRLQPRSRRRR